MSYIVVDVESNGEFPETDTGYSMICFGACIVESSLSKTFYGKTKPISNLWKPEAQAICGISREEHETFDDPKEVMLAFEQWIKKNTINKPIFISDNLAYDWSFINWYFHKYLGRNPFGYSGRRIGDLWCGYNNDMWLKWKWMRDTEYTHCPTDDAKGNAEALLKMKEKGLKINLI